jgi:hypothetical protein
VVSGKLENFPVNVADFSDIRQPGLAYFDKTKYILKLQKMAPNVQLVCRPRRFGKSLTVSMLQYFHGFQFRGQYDKLFKVCGYGMLLEQDLHAHITYTKVRISTWTMLSKMVWFNLDNTLSYDSTSPASPVIATLTNLRTLLREK